MLTSNVLAAIRLVYIVMARLGYWRVQYRKYWQVSPVPSAFIFSVLTRSSFSYLIHCSNVVEYYVDSSKNHFHGDSLVYNLLYSPVQLTQGSHRLYVKTISSIRAYGNTANVTFNCQVQPWQDSIKVINTVAPSVVDQYVRQVL